MKSKTWNGVIGLILIVSIIGYTGIDSYLQQRAEAKDSYATIGGQKIPLGFGDGPAVGEFRKVPVEESGKVAKDINNSTGTNLISINLSEGAAIMVTTYNSGAKVGIPTDQIVRFYQYDPGGNPYRRIELKNDVILNVTETFDQLRIKLQNTGWLIF